MTPLFEPILHLIHLGLLRASSIAVPSNQRAEWQREWRAELWHVRHACAATDRLSSTAEREVIKFCLGALQDAFWLRWYSWQRMAPLAASPSGSSPFSESAPKCLLSLTALLVASYAISLLLPGVRAENQPTRYQVSPGLILIQNARSNNEAVATIPIAQYIDWKGRRQHYFDDLAFYRIGKEAVSTETQPQAGWQVAHASSNLFALLGLAIRFGRPAGEAEPNLPEVILSDEAWKREFGANPQIAGSVIRVGQRQARIVGVVPDGAWRLPGKADAWLLEPDSEIAAAGVGHVVAHLRLLGQFTAWSKPRRVHIDGYSDDSADDLWGVSCDRRTRGPWGMFQFAVLLAFLALPALTSVSLGEYGVNPHHASWSRRLCAWGFLSSKMALLLPIVYFSSLDLAYWHTSHYSAASEYLQLASAFTICLFGLRWVLLDQRRRCPVCLRCVTNPAHVGQASRTFLTWNGIELMCRSGHTLLHVPALPTSWFNSQRWLYLDPSWEFLFVGSVRE